jgi:hypothetical protein
LWWIKLGAGTCVEVVRVLRLFGSGCIREMIERSNVATNFDELERAARSLFIQRPSEAKIITKHSERGGRYRNSKSILDTL